MGDYVLNFKDKTSINNELFYNIVIDSFKNFVENFKTDKFIIDFTNVSFIDPSVLPKLCCLGYRLNEICGITPQIIIEWNSSLMSYLSSIGFFNIIKRYNVFYVDDRLLGDFKEVKATNAFLAFDRAYLLKKSSEKFIFKNEISEKDKLKYYIDYELFGIDRNKSDVLKVLSNLIKDNNRVDEIALDFLEIIHNAIWHGDSICFISVQACTYKGKNNKTFSKVHISISDMGSGIYDTINKNNWEFENKTTQTIDLKKFQSLSDSINKNYFSILEALLFRKDDIIRGFYHVLLNLLDKENSALEILNENVWLLLNKQMISKILSMDSKKLPPYLKKINTQKKTNGHQPFLAIKESLCGGLHIDISFSI